MSQPDYKVNDRLVRSRAKSLATLWGRESDLVLHQSDDEIPHIDVYRFPVTGGSHIPSQLVVYNTSGMADIRQPVPDEVSDVPDRIEITAYAREPLMTDSGETDFIAWCMHWMAHFPLREGAFFAPGQTFDMGQSLTPDSEMSAYYLANTPFITHRAVTGANIGSNGTVHLVPISAGELQVALTKGPAYLVQLLQDNDIEPIFDLHRASCV